MSDAVTRLPKLCGADIELGNFLLGRDGDEHTDTEAAVLLLREIAGVPQYRQPPTRLHGRHGSGKRRRRAGGARAAFDPYDWNRKFLASTGGGAYIDQTHAELCLPEVRTARDHTASWLAMLRIAQDALRAANRRLPAGERLCLLANNTDGACSWGGHLNFLVARRAWDNLFHRRPHYQSFLMALQISSIVLTGQGKVGASNGRAPVTFQLTQRGDFFYTLVAEQTTYRRPLLNTRDESLCGDGDELARLHCIFFDTNLCPVAHLLKVGIMQIGLAMLEAGRVDPGVALEDPLAALASWGRDPSLRARARLLSGGALTALELQEVFCAAARRFVADGLCAGIVADAEEIVALWAETLAMLKSSDFSAYARRLDWALKLSLLAQAMRHRADLNWRSPEIRYLDQMYANLDPAAGLFWARAAAGDVEAVVGVERIEELRREPPQDTRAWTRAMLLRAAPAGSVVAMDWDWIVFESPAGTGRYRRVELADPLAATRAQSAPRLARPSFDAVLDAFGARPVTPTPRGGDWRREQESGASESIVH